VAVKKETEFLIGAFFSAAACIFQIIGLIRYLNRLPDDWFGIVLYMVTVVAFAVGAVGFFVQYRREKVEEKHD